LSDKPLALLSVSDKHDITTLAEGLIERGWEVTSTGGTARALREAGLEVIDVASLTGHPEMMEGRVKTLHPAIHAGILSRRTPEDAAAMGESGYRDIDLVAVNLYPFRETVAGGGVPVDQAMAKVDIGGPTMIRAAAKNHATVWAVVDPEDYGSVLDALDGSGGEEGAAALRRRLATKVFDHVASYDRAIATYFAQEGEGPASAAPQGLTVAFEVLQELRYGENPGQGASFLAEPGPRHGIAELKQLHGKALSYNNILDLDGALLALAPFAESERPAVAIVKHTTPCGLAVADSLPEAWDLALRSDPVSAFGSVTAFNRTVDDATAERISELFVECLVAPGFSEAAFERLSAKKNLRLLQFQGRPREFLGAHGRVPRAVQLRSVYGGVLAQTPPTPPWYGPTDPGDLPEGWSTVTERAPTAAEWDDLRFGWAAVFAVKSNAILLARGGATIGIGAGQMSRVDASKLAVRKAADAGLEPSGAVLASDAFFPFRDGVDAAAAAGVRAIVQPGGSIRDDEVIQAADEHGIAMVFTGRRLFRH